MYKQFPNISEDERQQAFILSIIEGWKNNDTYPGLLGWSTLMAEWSAFRRLDGIFPMMPIVRHCLLPFMNPLLRNGDLYRLGQDTKVRFGRDCSQAISKVPILDAADMPLGLDDVLSIITRHTVVGLGYVGITLAAHMVSKAQTFEAW